MSDPTPIHPTDGPRHGEDRFPAGPAAHPADPMPRAGAYEPGRARPGTASSAYDDEFLGGGPDYDSLYDPYDEPFDDDLEDLYFDADDGRGYGGGMADRGREAGESVLSMVRDNPVGTALTAAGIALLFAPRLERDDARRALDRARAQGRGMGGGTRGRFEEHRQRLDHTSRAARAHAERRSDELRSRLRKMRSSIEHGTQDLSEEARRRVVAARHRTLAARERALDEADRLRHRARSAASHGSEGARESVRDHPLLVGSLAVALGAALGAALPRSRFEDERFGSLSDRLAREAEDIYEREREMLAGAARGAWEEARQMATETADTAHDRVPDGEKTVEAAEDRLREGAARVVEGAKKGAHREGG